MDRFQAQPVDAFMDVYHAGKHPCHLLLQTENVITEDLIAARLDTLSMLASLRYVPGSLFRSAFWAGSNQSKLQIKSAVVKSFASLDPEALSEHSFITVTCLSSEAGEYGVMLSWDHTLTDARGGEYLLRYILGEDLKIQFNKWQKNRISLTSVGSFARYYNDRRLAGKEGRATGLKRETLNFISKEIWEEKGNTFFRSALLLTAAFKSIFPNHAGLLLAALPVVSARTRKFPGNQLGMMFIKLRAEYNPQQTYLEILSQMEQQVRDGINLLGSECLNVFARAGRFIARKMIEYPACNRFADLCLSSLGNVTVPKQIKAIKIIDVTHFPPLFEWGGESLIYYEVWGTAKFVHLTGKNQKMLGKMGELLKSDGIWQV